MIREGKENLLEGKSDKQLLEAAMEFTTRHHFKTDLNHITRTTDSRVSAVVLIWEDTHIDINNQMDNDVSLEVFYANQFREIYNQLLEGKAPSAWADIYQHEFNTNNNDYKNIVGIKFLFFQEYL